MAPNFIAQVTRNINKLELKITSVEAKFLINILKGSSSVKSLYLRDIRLSSINPETLSGAVTKLEKIYLCDAELAPEQLTSLMTALCERISLRVLTLDLAGLTSHLLKRLLWTSLISVSYTHLTLPTNREV